MVYAYLRVSTDAQDTENQRRGVDAKAANLGLKIDRYIIDDGISGTTAPEKRALGGLLRKISSNDVIICSELSRLGRKLFMIMRILEHCMKVGAKVYTVKDNYELGDNIQSKVLAFAFALSAEIERDLISQRTKEAMARRRAMGKYVGRKPGAKNLHHKLDGKENAISMMLIDGLSRREIAKKLKVSPTTVNKFIKSKSLLANPRFNHNSGVIIN
ncbi:MAG: recombinase family protein [Alphaproteobacteria bacterium]|nr:recombinase family protein [Alphaproteobacteria bacterium]